MKFILCHFSIIKQKFFFWAQAKIYQSRTVGYKVDECISIGLEASRERYKENKQELRLSLFHSRGQLLSFCVWIIALVCNLFLFNTKSIYYLSIIFLFIFLYYLLVRWFVSFLHSLSLSLCYVIIQFNKYLCN